jgi:hypothetical protein
VTTKIQHCHKIYPNGSSKNKMSINFTNIHHCRAPRNLPKLAFLVRKYGNTGKAFPKIESFVT